MTYLLIIVGLLILGGFLYAMVPRGRSTGDAVVDDREAGRD